MVYILNITKSAMITLEVNLVLSLECKKFKIMDSKILKYLLLSLM